MPNGAAAKRPARPRWPRRQPLFLGMLYAEHDQTPFLLTLFYLLGSVLYLSFVGRPGAGYLWRRYLVILLDLSVATFMTAYFSGAGVAFYPLFLWVMIGNGIRYGQHYMQNPRRCSISVSAVRWRPAASCGISRGPTSG